jgi:hypothetical protein
MLKQKFMIGFAVVAVLILGMPQEFAGIVFYNG